MVARPRGCPLSTVLGELVQTYMLRGFALANVGTLVEFRPRIFGTAGTPGI